jgi:hypothetical protein
MKEQKLNLPASVAARLLSRARQTGDDYQTLLTSFCFERFLYRLGVSSARARFVLKGAMLLRLWSDQPYRATRDLDLLRKGDGSFTTKSFNASYGDLPYAEKRAHYDSQNLLARSLHEKAYDHNPGFRRFIEASGLPLRPHVDFRKADLDARQELHRRLAERIWNPERLEQEAAS